MAKKRQDIIDRARELMSQHTDREIIPNIDDPDQHTNAMQIQNGIRRQLQDEFGVQRSTVISAMVEIIRTRRAPYMDKNENGAYINFDKPQ